MTQIINTISPIKPWLLAQTNPLDQLISGLGLDLGTSVLNLIKAVGILILGWVVATIVKGLVKGLLNRTNIDNKIASWISGGSGDAIPIEDWIASLFYWLILLFAIVGFLDALQLEVVSEPLNGLLNQVTGFLPKIVGAGILLGIAWLLATVVKMIVTRGLGALNLDERFGQQLDSSDFALSDTIGNALYWFIFLLFLPSVLNTLNLEGTLQPVQSLLDDILAAFPDILKALFIGAVGWFVAQIVRRLVTSLLSATGIDGVGEKVGLSGTGGQKSLSWIVGTVVFVLVLIPTVIAALEALQIEAISAPAINMLDQVSALLPKLFSAGIVLALAYMIGQYLSEFITNILTGIGFNNFFQWLGLTPPASGSSPSGLHGQTEQPTVIQSTSVGTKTPSEFVGIISLVAIMLVAALTAVDILGIQALADVVRIILQIAGQVFIAVVIFGIGLYLANLAFNLIVSSGAGQAKTLAQAARVAIVIFVGALALTEMGVAPNIVNLAFGLILGGIAVAIALAFGLGGREVAQEQLRSWVSSFKNR